MTGWALVRGVMRRAVVVLVIARAADAQSSSSSIAVSLGAEQTAQRNPGASPYAYDGFGPGGAVRYVRQSNGREMELSLAASQATLRSAITQGNLPTEALVNVRLRADYSRPLGARSAPLRWRVGAAALARGDIVRHDYAGPYGQNDYFGFALLSLGPSLGVELQRGRQTVSNRLATSLLGFIDYPYSNGKADGARLHLAFATLNRLQGIEDELSYHLGDAERRHLVWRYGFSYLRYAFDGSRRHARQSLALELNLPLGRRQP